MLRRERNHIESYSKRENGDNKTLLMEMMF